MDKIPSTEQIRTALLDLTLDEVRYLADRAECSFSTLVSIRYGYIKNPGIDTVRRFITHLPKRVKKWQN